MKNAEDEITEWFAGQSKLDASKFPIGIGDDMAQLQLTDDASVLITTDMLLDGVHFDSAKATLEQIGYKAMAVNLSDCAAMATQPLAAVVAVALPDGFGKDELKRLHNGIVSAGDKYNCKLVGGDITSWRTDGGLVVSAAMLSWPVAAKPVTRAGAKPGDIICVTGSLGGSLARRHLEFEPRVNEALKLAKLVAINAMLDISDGLSSDLNRICRQSKVGALIDAKQIPISETAKKDKDPLKAALNDGEDYELLFTLSESEFAKLQDAWSEQLTVTSIGRAVERPGMEIRLADGRIEPLNPAGFDHLKD